MTAAARTGLLWLGWTALAVVSCYWSLRTPLINGGWQAGDLNDYTLNLRHSQTVDLESQYPNGFTYPPPSVVFRLALDRLGFVGGSVVWLTLEYVGFWASLLAIFAVRKPTAACWWAALAAGFVLKWAWEFEFKFVNGNYIFMLLAAGFLIAETRNRSCAAGLCLAASVAFKLYSFAFVPLLLWERRWRTAAWTAVWSAGFWIALPAWWWGPAKSLDVTQAWRQALHETQEVGFPLEYRAYLVSIPKAILDVAADRQIVVDPATAQRIGVVLGALWLLATLAAFVLVPRQTDWAYAWAFLLTWPLAASPQLQPHHLVCLTPAVAIALASAFQNPKSVRSAIVLAFVVAAWAALEHCPHRIWRGPCTLAAIGLVQAGLLLSNPWAAGVRRCASDCGSDRNRRSHNPKR